MNGIKKGKIAFVSYWLCTECGTDYDHKWEAQECKCGKE